MRTQRSERRRVLTRYSAQDRERLIQEQAQSGLTKVGFCRQRGITLSTFHGWRSQGRPLQRQPALAEVELRAAEIQAAVEVLLPNGARVGIRHQGKREELVALVRGVAGYAGEAPRC